MPWEYDDDMLQTLCLDCHAKQHVPPPPLETVCCLCGVPVTNANEGGRNGKHEWICEDCIRKQAEDEVKQEGYKS